MLQKLHAFLLTVDDDLIEMWSAQLLGLNNKVILGLVSKVYVHLVLMHYLSGIRIHLCDVRGLQVVYSSDICCGLVQEVSADPLSHTLHLLHMIGLLANWFFRIWSLLRRNANLLMASLLLGRSRSKLIEVLLHHCGVRCLHIASWWCLGLKLEKVWSARLSRLHFVLWSVISTVESCSLKWWMTSALIPFRV